MSGNVRGIAHIGITVPDVEAATRFLSKAFDATIVTDTVADGLPRRSADDPVATVALNETQRIIATRIVRLGDSANIELFEIEGVVPRVHGLGTLRLQHFAVYCYDIANALRRVLAARGTHFRGPNPLFGAEKGLGNAMHYVRAPWGTLIELISTPAGTAPGRETDGWQAA